MKRGYRASKTDLPQKCVFCRKTGKFLSVDRDKEEQPPAEFARFEVVLVSGYEFTTFTILRCPECGTSYKKQRFTDNEILYGFDVDEYEELSSERVGELIAFHEDLKRKRIP